MSLIKHGTGKIVRDQESEKEMGDQVRVAGKHRADEKQSDDNTPEPEPTED